MSDWRTFKFDCYLVLIIINRMSPFQGSGEQQFVDKESFMDMIGWLMENFTLHCCQCIPLRITRTMRVKTRFWMNTWSYIKHYYCERHLVLVGLIFIFCLLCQGEKNSSCDALFCLHCLDWRWIKEKNNHPSGIGGWKKNGKALLLLFFHSWSMCACCLVRDVHEVHKK